MPLQACYSDEMKLGSDGSVLPFEKKNWVEW
jgi:hypothetical protein